MATKRKKTLAELMQERAQQSTDTSAYTTNPMPRANLNNDTWNRVINRRNAILNDTEMFVRNTGLGAKSGVVSALGQTEFLTQQKNEAYRKFREADTQLRNIDKNLSVEEKLKKENEKLEKTKNVNGIIVTKRPEIKDSAIMQDFAKEQEEINKKIAENTEKTKTKLGKFYAGNVAPSMGQSLTGTALDIMAPGMGSGYRLLSYSGNYTQDALNSGMKEKESAMYGLTMGAVESAMDAVGDKLKGKLIGEGKTAKGLKEFLEIGAEELGVNSFVEGIGEALTEPLQEKAKELYGGKADYNNILQRMGQSFVSGVASELLMSGASLGYSGSINVINKIQNGEQVSTNEISDALKEINEKEEIDITKILANQFELTSQDLYINKDVQQKTNTKLENMAQDISKGEFKGIKNNSLIEDSGLDKEEKKILTEITQKYNLSEENVKKLIEKTENGWFYKNQPTTIENKPISKQTQQVISNEGKMAENGMSQETSNIGQNVQKTTENTKNNKQKQFEIIQKTNPMQDDYHVGIRNVEDIKTFEEAIQDDESFVWGDYSEEDAKRDLQKGTVTVYSSKPIEDGVFVSTSKNQAQDYAGSGKVYSQEVSIDDVAWINGDEGQFAKIETPNIENNQQTMYNDFESEGVLNGKQNVNKGRNDEIWNREIEEGSENTRKYTDEEYDNWERNIKPISEEKLTDSEKEIIKKAKNDYNKEVRLYDENENDNTYAGGASRIVKGRINISRQEAEATGLNFMIDHENVESDILYNDTALDLLEPIIDAIMQDNNFDNQMVEFWKDQKGNRPKDSLIAKDIICDRFAERNQQQETKYKNVLSQETNQIIDRALDSYYYQVYGKELQDFKYNTKDSTESSFSMQKNVREDGLLDARTETTTKNVKKKTLNPTEISNLTMEDASSTPKLIGKKKARGNKQSNFLKNITVKSRFLNQDFRNELTEEDNIRYYNGISNIDTLNKAYDDLQAEGQKGTLEWFNKDSSQATAEDTAKGWILLKQYQDAGDYQSAVEVAKKMREIGTSAGQTIQAFNILSRLTPNGMFYYAQKELSEIYSEMSKGKTKEWIDKHKTDFDLTPIETQFIKDTMEEVSTMDDGYEKKVKLAEIQKLITNKIPPTAGKSIKAWMRISMLFNPKTQVRNVLGNAVTLPVNLFSDMFSTAVDKAIAKKTGKRTTGMINLKEYGKGFGKGLYESYNDFKKGVNTKEIQGNRFEVTDGKSFKDEGIGKALNFTDNVLNFVMDAGDRSFYEATFTNSINNQLVLNNTTEVTQEMIDIATQEALSRTWQDDNAYTQAVLMIRNALNGKIGKSKGLAYGLGDVIIPFAKTPANLTKAIVDYSPVGLVKTLAIDAKKFANSLENGQYDAKQQHKFVQNLGKGMAGSLLYVLGYALANAGIISGEADEDKDVKNFMRNSLGIGSYSIKIGDKSFAYDWAQPVATPFAIMSNYVKTSKENPDANILEKAISAVNIGTEQLLEQSFMESINTVLNGNGTTLENLTQAVMELPSRAIPTFSKQIADLVDSTQRTTFEYGKPVKSAVNAVVAKIPGLSKTLPAQVDTFGNEIQKYGGDNSVFNVFFNPANMNKGTLTKAGQEIYNLYQETGNTAIFPRTAPYYINNKNEKVTMDAKQRADFQKVTGQYVQKNLNSLLDNKQYLSLNADERAKFLEEVVADSYSKAKYEILGIESEDGAKKREKIENVGEKTYYDFNIRLDKLQREKERNNETVKDSEKIEILHDATYNKDTKSKVYEYMLGGNKDDVYNSLKQLTNNKVTINDYLGYKTADLSADKKDDGTKKGKSISGSAKKKLLDFLNNSNLSYIERLYIYGTKYPNLTSAQKTSLINKIKSLNLTSEEQKQIYLELKDVEELKDGRIRWK